MCNSEIVFNGNLVKKLKFGGGFCEQIPWEMGEFPKYGRIFLRYEK